VLLPDPSPFELEITIAMLKRYKSSGRDQVPAELIQAGGEILRSGILKLITSIWNKEKFVGLVEGIYYCTSSQKG
jgi:hypothetical protein